MAVHHNHPTLHKTWRTSLSVKNETSYDTIAIRKLVIAALREVCLPVRGTVRITYSSAAEEQDPRHHHRGSAAMGRTTRNEDGSFRTLQGLTMVLTLPRNPEKLDVTHFALVIRHEALHWKGVDHKDMTENQLWCKGPTPAWAENVAVPFKVRAKPNPRDERAKRLERARAMLKKSERKAKLAETLVKRWKRRVAALERAMLKTVDSPPV